MNELFVGISYLFARMFGFMYSMYYFRRICNSETSTNIAQFIHIPAQPTAFGVFLAIYSALFQSGMIGMMISMLITGFMAWSCIHPEVEYCIDTVAGLIERQPKL